MNIETVQIIYGIILKFHVLVGSVGFIFLLGTLFSLSKPNLHRKWGIGYWLLTSLVCYSSILCGLIYLYFFRAYVHDPDSNIENTIIFLLHMSFLTIGVLNSGRDFIQFAKGSTVRFKWYTVFPYTLAFLISILLGFKALKTQDFQLFLVCTIAMPIYMILYFWRIYGSKKNKINPTFLYWHVQAMLTSTIAYYTPTFSGGMARTYFPTMYKHTAQYLFISPPILGIIIIILLLPFRKKLLYKV